MDFFYLKKFANRFYIKYSLFSKKVLQIFHYKLFNISKSILF